MTTDDSLSITRGQPHRRLGLEAWIRYARTETYRLRGGEIALEAIHEARSLYLFWLLNRQQLALRHAWFEIRRVALWLEQLSQGQS